MGQNAKGETFDPGVMRCHNCTWWARLTADPADEHRASMYGPWPDQKPAGDCKRFPPTHLWGVTETAQAHGIGRSILTWHDDFCGEFAPDRETCKTMTTPK